MERVRLLLVATYVSFFLLFYRNKHNASSSFEEDIIITNKETKLWKKSLGMSAAISKTVQSKLP